MAVPIVETIAALIAAKLATITVANGYEVDVAAVARPTRLGGYKPEHLMIVFEQGDNITQELYDIEGSPPGRGRTQEFQAHLYLKPPKGSSTAVDIVVNQFVADVAKAVMADPQWSSNAIDTRIGDVEAWFKADDAFEGVSVSILVDYRIREDDHYTVV